MEREGVSTLSICSYLRALICLAHFLKYLVLFACFEKYFEMPWCGDLIYDNSCISPQEC